MTDALIKREDENTDDTQTKGWPYEEMVRRQLLAKQGEGQQKILNPLTP